MSFVFNVLNSYLGLLNRYPAELNIKWTTFGKDPVTNETFDRRLTGPSILLLLMKGYSIKIFEKLNTKLKRQAMSKKMHLIKKMDIFQDYSYPKPFPRDKFLKLPDGSPNQAYLMLATKGTGE